MLVDAEQAKEKLAKVCERTIPVIAENGNVHGVVPMNAKQCAAAIRAADLSDCRVRGDTKLVDDLRRQLDPDFTKAMPHAEKLMAQSADAIESLSAQVAELKGHLKEIEFSASGYCPACSGWEVTKGRGCQPKVHTKTCWLDAAKEGK